MKKRSGTIIARIMALLMVISALPADLMGSAGVVMAEELNNDSYVNSDGPESIGGITQDEKGTNDTEFENDNESGNDGGGNKSEPEVVDGAGSEAGGQLPSVSDTVDEGPQDVETDPDEADDISNADETGDIGNADETGDVGDADETGDIGDADETGDVDDADETAVIDNAEEAVDAEVSEDIAADAVKITECGGYEEGVYAEWEAVEGADGYRASISKDGGAVYERIDNELIRKYPDYWRVDAVGLAAGSNYVIKIEAGSVTEKDGKKDLDTSKKIVSAETDKMTVTNYDRSGFAFSEKSQFGTGSGAYNDDGTLRSGAQVVYVTADTAKTCTALIHSNGASKPAVEVTGLQSILDAKQKSGTDIDVIDIRVIGCLNREDLDHISSASEGLQVKGKAYYSGMNMTIEGIGEDATIKGFGFLIRNCGNVELRNFAIMNFMDDGVSIDTGNCNVWVHDIELFYGAVGGDSDQAKGDGSVDIKGASTNITVSYNHFWDSGKCSLCGMGDSAEFLVTYHHNWFDHSDSRHPRIRVASVHLYNNYFDGNSKYGVGTTKGSNAFVEANYFRGCKNPMMSSLQGSDARAEKGTFSGENGGMIKAFNNKIEGAHSLVYANSDGEGSTLTADPVSFDAYLASARDEKVPSTYKTVKGGTVYNNFDTDTDKYDLGVKPENIDSPDDVKDIVTSKAGRLGGGDISYTFSSSEDSNYGVIPELKSIVEGYQSSVKSIGGIDGVSTSGGLAGAVVAAPYADKASGEVAKGTTITLKTSTPGAKIYYTTDGTVPTAGSMEYTAAITVNEDIVIKAVAVLDGVSSTVSTYTYTIPSAGEDTGAVKAPTSSKASGTVNKGEKITLINNAAGATVYYTEDGTDPTSSAAAQTFTGDSKEITINETVTIRAAAKSGDEWSKIVTFVYTVSSTGTTPSPAGGYVHNFTISGKTSDFYAISGNMKSNPPKVTYNGLELTAALKMETATSIKFTSAGAGTLILVHGTDFNGKTKVDGNNETASAGIITVKDLAAGQHEISKGDSANLYYIEFKPDDAAEDSDTVSAPWADIPDGSKVEKGTEVYLGCDTDGADVYFTIDGTTPSAQHGTLYNDANEDVSDGPVVIDKDTTIKAIAVKGDKTSGITEFSYTVFEDEEEVLYAEAPKANPSSGKVKKETKITLSSGTQGDDVKILYTTDGSDPKDTKNANVYLYYDGAITINYKTTIKAYTQKPGYISSNVSTFVYTVVSDTAATDKYEFNPQLIAQEKGYANNTDISATGQYGTLKDNNGYFTLVNTAKKTSMFQTADSSGVKVEADAPSDSKSGSGITKYNWRYKYGSASGSDNRKITFTNTGSATVTICAYVAADKLTENRTVMLDNASRILTDVPTEYTFENVQAGTHSIKAGVGDHFILYIVVEEDVDSETEPEPYDAGITADPAPDGGYVEKGAKVTLNHNDPNDKLYYTLDDTDPRAEGGNRKEYASGDAITINKTTTIRAVAQKTDGTGLYSKPAVFKYEVGGDSGNDDYGAWYVELDGSSFIYTGAAIKPAVTVYGHNGNALVEGSDYTVKYRNNVNASVKADANGGYKPVNENKLPAVTITGKGIISGKETITFEIRPKDISDAVTDDSMAAADIVIQKGKKISAPAIFHNGLKLKINKDYAYKTAADKTKTDWSENDAVTVVGQGNYEGALNINVRTYSKDELKNKTAKFKVTLDGDKVKKLVYSGTELDREILDCIKAITPVSGADKDKNIYNAEGLGTKYAVIMPDNTLNAGTVKFTVVGLGDYSGCSVSKSVKIQPRTITGSSQDTASPDKVVIEGAENTAVYTGSGAMLDDLIIKWNGDILTNGKDYKLTFSGNKKADSNAKYTITFKGNFKGRLAEANQTFKVEKAALDSTVDGIEAVALDKICKENASCKAAPYVTINNILVKASEYEVTYSVGSENGTYTSKPKAKFNGADSATVYMKIKAKGKNYKTEEGKEVTGSYTIWNKAKVTAGNNLSKAKVIFYSDDKLTARASKFEFTGEEVVPAGVKVTIGKNTPDISKNCEIIYVNNVNKGKVTVIVKPREGSGLMGAKSSKFSIVSRNIGNNPLDKVFDEAAAALSGLLR